MPGSEAMSNYDSLLEFSDFKTGMVHLIARRTFMPGFTTTFDETI